MKNKKIIVHVRCPLTGLLLTLDGWSTPNSLRVRNYVNVRMLHIKNKTIKPYDIYEIKLKYPAFTINKNGCFLSETEINIQTYLKIIKDDRIK
jgi:hypothetical protein